MKNVGLLISIALILNGFVPDNAQAFSLAPNLAEPMVSNSVSVIVVPMASPPQTIISPAVAQENIQSACVFAAVTRGNVLQNANLANLNQPAGCFVLVASRMQELPHIAVVNLSPAGGGRVVVQMPPVSITGNSFLPYRSAAASSLPVAAYVVGLYMVYEVRRVRKNFTKKESFNNNFHTSQLLILRC